QHDFPVDLAIYQPVSATVDQLDQALSRLPGGYIAVLGGPGTGKSTLLTQTLRGRSERVVRYYAYVPDAQDPIVTRGEAANFLHDMVVALENVGFRTGAAIGSANEQQLQQQFQRQLELLHADFRTQRHKTIILIDGLDHIAREQRPQRSLLNVLPFP